MFLFESPTSEFYFFQVIVNRLAKVCVRMWVDFWCFSVISPGCTDFKSLKVIWINSIMDHVDQFRLTFGPAVFLELTEKNKNLLSSQKLLNQYWKFKNSKKDLIWESCWLDTGKSYPYTFNSFNYSGFCPKKICILFQGKISNVATSAIRVE